MTTPNESDPIARRAREVFDAASGDVDATTAGRLRLARRAALAAPAPSPRAWLAPLAGAAALGLVAWLAWPRAQAPEPVPAPVATAPVTPAAIPPPPSPAVPDPAVPAQPRVEAPLDDPLDAVPVDDDTAWAALDEDDAELYAWLADAPVAPDTGEESL